MTNVKVQMSNQVQSSNALIIYNLEFGIWVLKFDIFHDAVPKIVLLPLYLSVSY
jgi:hypothetical protein